MVCKRELGGETRRPSGAIRGIHRGRLEAGIRADEVGEGEGRSRMGMMCCGKRVAWPPCGTRSPTKHCKLERRRTREVQRDGAETYIVFRCTRLRCAPAEEQTGRGGAVKRFREVSALLAVPVADHARRDGSSSPDVRSVRCTVACGPARAPGFIRGYRSLYHSDSGDSQTPTHTDTPRAAHGAGSSWSWVPSATHSVASHSCPDSSQSCAHSRLSLPEPEPRPLPPRQPRSRALRRS